MAEFIPQRDALNHKRSEYETVRLNLFAGQERLKLLECQKKALDRKGTPDNVANQTKVEEIEARMRKLSREVEANQGLFNHLAEELSGIYVDFESLTDPRDQLPRHFKNITPFLLFPVRLETRFKTVPSPNSEIGIPQMWVRIYPDTCLVDSFDPQLSDQEIRNAARFWAEYYAAGQITDENNPDPETLKRQKAAWAFLVNLEGAGRAAWIVQSETVTPQAGSVFPTRNTEATIILTIATEDDSILANQAAIFTFFKDLWFAGKNEELATQIKNAFPDAESVIEKFLPVNFEDPLPSGLKRENANLEIALVLLPDSLDATGKSNSWSQPARMTMGPERFVLIGYKNGEKVLEQLGNYIPTPLQVGFDPNAGKEHNFSPTESGDLEIPEELKWIIDFEDAVKKGMGFKVNLSRIMLSGFDRLFVLGVRLSADETAEGGSKEVSELLHNHYYSQKGFGIVPQGTPTNNTEKERAAFSDLDDPEATFDLYFKQKPAYTPSADWQQKRDGQWLGEWLGLNDSFFQKVLNAGGFDQCDALNMNLALWPGTLGYAMDAMMKPVFGEESMDYTRQFFSMFVSGRGTVPAIRIGNQPYGILPTTAFGRQAWMYPEPAGGATFPIDLKFGVKTTLATSFFQTLYEILKKIETDWRATLVPKVAHVSAENPDQTHQQLLDIVGLHANSVEFYHRYLQSLEMLYSYATLSLPFGEVQKSFNKMEFGTAFKLLEDLGYQSSDNEGFKDLPLLSKLYGLDYNWEHKVLIDTVPLSEVHPIRSYTADDKNYVTALKEAAATSLDALRKGSGITETPSALLYSFLKFALEQGYFDTAVKLHEAAQVFTRQQAQFVRTEQPFLHMTYQDQMVESRYAVLYKNDDRIAKGKLVADYITELIRRPPELFKISPGLAQQLAALKHLENASTARLERAFVEHLDCCAYRLDAWQQGLIRLQLMFMRNNQPRSTEEGGEQPNVQTRKGLYVGAFGWLENVKPETDKVLEPVIVPEDLKQDFPQDYVKDEANAGYIHAPSVNHAVSAAVLRNAFLTNGKEDNNSELAVNLSSERVRLALSVIEGIQNGQSLAALLGYKLERTLHDQQNLVNKGIDTYIYALRKLFPLNANLIKETDVNNDPSVDPDTVPISAIEARNVIHGKNLINHIKKQSTANKSYPFGFPATKLPNADAVISTAINAAVDLILNVEDAIADLAMAESVHQVCIGNYDRAAGVLDTYSNGSYPQIPDIIQTPRSGPTLTHRVGIPFEFISTIPYEGNHPRKSAEPTLNQWLSMMIPDLDDVLCHFSYTDRTDNIVKEDSVSLQTLGFSPLDLLYLLDNTGQAALTRIDDGLIHYIYKNLTPKLDAELILEYIKRPAGAGKFALFEILSLMRSLRALVLESPNLKPSDISMTSEASSTEGTTVTLDQSRVENVINDLNNYLDNDFTTNVLNVLNALSADPDETESENIRANLDNYLAELIDHLDHLGRFGLAQTGFGNLYNWRQETIIGLRKKVEEIITRLTQKASEYNALEVIFDPLATDAIEQLQKMERLISTTDTDPAVIDLPAVQAKKALFDAKLAGLEDIIEPTAVTGIFVLLDNLRTQIGDLSEYDVLQVDLSVEERSLVRFVLDDLQPRAQGLYDLAKKQTQAAADLLVDLETLDGETQVVKLQTAARAIFGDEFRLIPRYDLETQQGFELQNVWDNSNLLDYLKNQHNPKFLDPTEDWLHGTARVREKMHHAENCFFLREAFDLAENQFGIHPVQLPFQTENYHWLALPFPEDTDLTDGEHLLYTALTSVGASAPTYACGLLIDEWTEVIPTEKETTGLSFHYDRPNSEAPQTILLVTPTDFEGNWKWEDLVDALHFALDSARLRAVEPSQIDTTPYARYLPALISPAPRYPITMAMYIADLPLQAAIVNS